MSFFFRKINILPKERITYSMNHGRIVIITGAPGTGKTTAASIIATESDFPKSIHMRTDDFYHHLCKGTTPRHLPEAYEQNSIVIEAFMEAAKCYVRGEYDVIIDAVIGPQYLNSLLKTAHDGYEIHYIVLRASKEETLKRATERSKKWNKPIDPESIAIVWEQFHLLGHYESHVINTMDLSPKATVLLIQDIIKRKTHLLL